MQPISDRDINHSIEVSLERIIKTLPDNSCLPFRIIKWIAKNCPFSFCQAVFERRGEAVSKEKAETSCIHTLYSLIPVFSGKRAEQILKLITYTLEVTDTFQLFNHKLRVKFKDIFTGYVISQSILHDKNDTEKSLSCSESDPHYQVFKNSVKVILCQIESELRADATEDDIYEKLEEKFNQQHTHFNSLTFSNFEECVIQNRKKIDPTCSSIYYLWIRTSKYFVPNPPQDAHYLYVHAFAIEQFFSPKQGVLYRFYQSWVNESTLLDNFKKNCYGKTDEGCLNEEQFNQFLLDFKKLTCEHIENIAKIKLIWQRHFNCQKDFPLAICRFDKQKKSFFAITLIFNNHLFNPADCSTNFLSFVKTHPSLSKSFSDHLYFKSEEKD